MAESVDALVSNTSGATRAGSTPALGTTKPLAMFIAGGFCFLATLFIVYKLMLFIVKCMVFFEGCYFLYGHIPINRIN